uniref:PDZ domain-containing protein n=1 Tax=Strongyloides papillosus TaxID=174720 RepID=A0A0N5BZP6_STREA
MNTYNEPSQTPTTSKISTDQDNDRISKSAGRVTEMVDDYNKTKFVKNSSTSQPLHNTLPSTNPFKITGARKSKINDNFFIMKERLEEKMNEKREFNESVSKKNVSFQVTRIPYDMLEECYRHEHKPTEWSVITLNSETKNIPVGIEDSFTPITAPNSRKLDSIEIDDIEPDSRIYLDGRFREGDHIKEINGRPVYQMSSQRVKSYLEEMKSMENPSLTLDVEYEKILQRTEEIKNKSLKSSSQKGQLTELVTPIQSKLQQVNSTLIKSNEKNIVLKKNNNGFGFNVTSRYNAQNECLLYVSAVKLDSVAYGILEIGDRILKLNGNSLVDSSQSQFVSQLKNIPIGEEIVLCIARSDDIDKKDSSTEKVDTEKKQQKKEIKESVQKKENSQISFSEKVEVKDIFLPFNSTPSSGLGISLKARCIHRANGERQDVGIFVKKTLVGGSAYNSGLLKENDRILGIEGIDLTQYPTNKEAFETIAECLGSLDKNKTHVQLKISRIIPINRSSDDDSLENVKIDVVRDDQSNDYLYEPSNPVNHVLIKTEKNGVTSVTVNDQDSDVLTNAIQNEDDLYFDRQSKTRQSISEKRKNVTNNDPSNLEVFQKIKHLRQTSAPTTTTQSFSKYSPSLNLRKLQNIDNSKNLSFDEKSIDIGETPTKSIIQISNKNSPSTPVSVNQYRPQRSRSSDMTQKKNFFEKNKTALISTTLKNSSPIPNIRGNIVNVEYNEVPTIEKYEKHMYQGPAVQAIIPQSQSFHVPIEKKKDIRRIQPPPSYSQTLDKKNISNRYTMMDPSVSYHVVPQQKPNIIPHYQNNIFHSPIPPPRFGGREDIKHEIQVNNDYYDAFNNYFVASETLPNSSNGVNKITMPRRHEKTYPYVEGVISPQASRKKFFNDGRSHSVFYYDTVTPTEVRKSGVTVKRF